VSHFLIVLLKVIMPSVAFSNCYAEYRYAECRYAECRYTERRYTECRYAERRYAEFVAPLLSVIASF
jgi:hypothetical protein